MYLRSKLIELYSRHLTDFPHEKQNMVYSLSAAVESESCLSTTYLIAVLMIDSYQAVLFSHFHDKIKREIVL